MRSVIFTRQVVFIFSAVILVLFSRDASSLELNGFVEGAYGYRSKSDTTKKDGYNLLEARSQIKGSHSPELMEDFYPELTFKADLVADGYESSLNFMVREAALSLTPAGTVDMKVGRQVLTWGTGDLVFVNDLFPKDYVSFFTGREDEYLKLPSNAVRVSIFADIASFDIALAPQMEHNNSVTGSRFSFYDGLAGRITGDEANRDFIRPEKIPENMEIALRAYRTVGSFEAAFYLFRGFYNEPRGIFDPAKEQFIYPRLGVYGLSLRGPLLGGIGNFETGYYDSRDDRSGRDRFIENPSIKYLAGYSKDMGGDLSIGGQYLIEHMLGYSYYREGLGQQEPARDEFRHLLTLRITKLYKNQTIVAGLFAFYSPSDRDAYLRPAVSYKLTDSTKVSAGANIFTGRYDHTEFGQFELNDNLYMRVRYTY